MKVISSIADLRAQLGSFPSSDSLGFVPTMGALHEGHLSLVRQSRQQCERTAVSIFVNPTQFAPNEDLTRYPRPLEADLALLEAEGVDVVFTPTADEIYPPECTTTVTPPAVSKYLEGEHRPEHFRGVATIVLKLFHLVQPDLAFFGQKDYQQSLVVRHLVRDLNLPVRIQVCPIVRDPDGLALSSRNVFLTDEQREVALSLHRTLQAAAQSIEDGETDGHVVKAQMTQTLIEAGVDEVDYALIAHADTLQTLDFLTGPLVLLVAAHVGSTRLIDNFLLTSS